MLTIGVPKEIMPGEGRVALSPGDCAALVQAGARVFLETAAGDASGYTDADYQQAGVAVLATAAELYQAAELIVKVKQPLPADLELLNSHHIVFSFLHLAADPALVARLCEIGLSAIPFEAVSDQDRFPLLAPMSAIAGRLAVLRGADLLCGDNTRGVLLGGVRGSDSGRVVVLGAGVAGSHALAMAVALGADVAAFDLNLKRLSALGQRWPQIQTHEASPEAIAEFCEQADLVIGAVMLAGRRAPVVLSQTTIARMSPGTVIIDIAIDQGGCVEGVRTTSAQQPVYRQSGVLISAVANMPGAVPRTATQALSSVITPYIMQLVVAWDRSREPDTPVPSPALVRAMAIQAGRVVDPVLRQALT